MRLCGRRRRGVRDREGLYNALIKNELHRISPVPDRFSPELEHGMQGTKVRELGKKRWGKRFLNEFAG
jgi:hypothetical protein